MNSSSHIKEEVLTLIRAYQNGLSEVELSKTMDNVSPTQRMEAINALTNEGLVQLCKRGSELIYRAIDASNLSAFTNIDISIEERAVYRVIELAGNKGIWNKDIRTQTKLPLIQLSKILKNLETKKLIKAIKSVAASKRKVYMLYNIEPDKSVTGGAWYAETEFDSSFVTVLHEQCYEFIKNQDLISSVKVKEYIDNLKISNVDLSLQDLEMVLETIVYDGLIEKFDSASDDTTYYRALKQPLKTASVMRVPCGQCPHINECRPGAVICPEKCLYFERWFGF